VDPPYEEDKIVDLQHQAHLLKHQRRLFNMLKHQLRLFNLPKHQRCRLQVQLLTHPRRRY